MSADIITIDSSPTGPTETSQSHPSSSQTSTFSPSDRIKQLNKIDKEITSLLNTASAAITTLSAPTPSKSAFKTQSAQYHSSVQSIVTSLKRQIYALEQADIPLPTILTSSGASNPAPGGGGLDIGALGGRSDAVGRKMDQELWKKAREMVDGENVEGGEKVDLRLDVEITDAL